jgi:hypothetical protein
LEPIRRTTGNAQRENVKLGMMSRFGNRLRLCVEQTVRPTVRSSDPAAASQAEIG